MNHANGLKELPRGWVWTTLGEIAEIKLGKMLSPKAFDPALKQLPYLRNENVRWFFIDTTDVKSMGFAPEEIEKYRLCIGDLLVCEGGEPGRCAVVTPATVDFMIQKALHRVRPVAEILDSRLLQYCFKHFIDSGTVIERRSETTIQHLPREKLVRVHVPVPPKNEQSRIVSKIDELFSDLDAGVAALERVKANLKRYRAAVLNAAVTGKLTERWRQSHPPTEPAAKLLERILVERRKKWESDQLAKFAAAKKEPPKNWREKYEEPVAPDTSALPALPHGWCWTTLDAISTIAGGITKGQRYAPETPLREVPYLRVANVQRGYLDLSEMKTIPATATDIDALRLQRGDILFNEGGDRDKLGRGWVWNDELPECIHQNHVFRARLLVQELQPKLISFHGNSFGQEWFLRTGKQSVNLASINMTVLRNFPVPLAPADEQKEIVAEVEWRLSTADAVLTNVDQFAHRASRLRQSILKRAFEGKLVPQDAADEPASTLLARIESRHLADPHTEHEVKRRQRRPSRTLTSAEGLFDAG